MNNADLIVAILKANGITRGFGIPSGNVLPLMEAMRKGGVEFVLTAHEGSAGFAADVAGRMTERPGLCIATLGPGATNLATGFGPAAASRAGASATSSGRSRCTGPRGSLMAMRMASLTVSAILPFSSRNDALVIGLNNA